MIRPMWLIVLLLGALAAPSAPGQDRLPASLNQIGLDQRLDEQVPLDLAFQDEAGQTVRLGDFFSGKPVIVVLAYYRCPMLCTQVLNGLLDSLRGISLDAGNHFHVVVVSFDARETPELAAAKKATYVASYGRTHAAAGWHFLTGGQPAVAALTQAVGFRYVYDPKLDQFAHASGIMILTPQGKIARYFYGIHYQPRDLRLALVEASANKIGTPADRLLLLCYHYDPATGQYSLMVLNLVRLGGVVLVMGLGIFIILARRNERRRLAFRDKSPVQAQRTATLDCLPPA